MIAITYIGHATALIQWGDTYFLTDPNFSPKVFFLKRQSPLNFDPATLPDLECVLLSHTHFDHLDIRSYKFISCQVPLVVPRKVARLLHRWLPHPVLELPARTSWTTPQGFTITAWPARHWGGRYSGVRYTACNSYLIEKDGKRIYFAGDSAYQKSFAELGHDKNIDLALLPIGAYRPRWFMKYRHMNPQEALQAAEDLRAQTMIPIHWGTFRLSTEPLTEPISTLQDLVADTPWAQRTAILQPGEKREIGSFDRGHHGL